MTKKLALAAAMMVVAMGSVQAQTPTQVQNVRQTGMDLAAGTFGNIRAVVAAKGKIKSLEFSGKSLARWATLIPSLFPAGSDKGKTKAKAEIWTDPEGFKKDAMALASASETLAKAAHDDDATAVAAAIKPVAEACGACHKHFREK
jgi:cytochrome c556